MSWQFSGYPPFKPGANLGPRFREDDDEYRMNYNRGWCEIGWSVTWRQACIQQHQTG